MLKMNTKTKKADHKKLLVRNTSTNPSKTSVVSKVSDQTKTTKNSTKSVTTISMARSERPVESKRVETFETPELNSVLKLAKKIETVESLKPKKTKSTSALDSNRLSVDEKLTRVTNYPYDQPIYKDLIPIDCKYVTQTPPVSSRVPLPYKDKKPILSDFFQPRKCKEYYFLHKNQQEKSHPLTVRNDNLRLYRTLQLAHEKV